LSQRHNLKFTPGCDITLLMRDFDAFPSCRRRNSLHIVVVLVVGRLRGIEDEDEDEGD
jgi:hypothetical protein